MLGYLIDMDGVIYRGGQLIPGADRFVNGLREANIPFLFLTNNSQRTRRDVATGSRRLGIDVDERAHFHLCDGDGAVPRSQKPHGTAFVIGEGGLLTALHENGYSIVDKDPDYVVVGEGRTVSFEMLEAALGMILGGAKLVATNLDPNCPTVGRHPARAAAPSSPCSRPPAGVKAFSVGKPSPVMLRAARKELGLTTDQTIVIGDTMETDILGGVQLGYKTILVLSGGTRREDLARYAYRPDQIVDSIADLDPAELERQYGAGQNSSLAPFHPSHRPRRKPAMTGVY